MALRDGVGSGPYRAPRSGGPPAGSDVTPPVLTRADAALKDPSASFVARPVLAFDAPLPSQDAKSRITMWEIAPTTTWAASGSAKGGELDLDPKGEDHVLWVGEDPADDPGRAARLVVGGVEVVSDRDEVVAVALRDDHQSGSLLDNRVREATGQVIMVGDAVLVLDHNRPLFSGREHGDPAGASGYLRSRQLERPQPTDFTQMAQATRERRRERRGLPTPRRPRGGELQLAHRWPAHRNLPAPQTTSPYRPTNRARWPGCRANRPAMPFHALDRGRARVSGCAFRRVPDRTSGTALRWPVLETCRTVSGAANGRVVPHSTPYHLIVGRTPITCSAQLAFDARGRQDGAANGLLR